MQTLGHDLMAAGWFTPPFTGASRAYHRFRKNFSLSPFFYKKIFPQISGYVRLREEQSTLGERVNGRKPEDGAREGRGDGDGPQAPRYGQFQQISGKNEI